jgi:hypothetical protein
MDMKVDKIHYADLIEDSMKKPLFPKLVKLIGASA